jgi:hypothetical protein
MKTKDPKYLIGFSKNLNSKPTEFKRKIRERIKTLTIRLVGKKPPPKVGQILRMYMGLRTSQCEPVFDFENGETEPRCTGVWPIEMWRNGYGGLSIDTEFFLEILDRARTQYYDLRDPNFPGDNCDHKFLNRFAKMDGWNSFSEMIEFFELPLKANIYFWGAE